MSEIVLSCNNLGKRDGDMKGKGPKEKCGWKVNKAPHFIVHISFMGWQSKDYFMFFKFVYLSGYYSEKAMATHSGTFAWKIPWMEEPGRLQSMGLLKSRTWLSDFTFTFHYHALEKEMATHSSVLAWRIPGKEYPGGLPSMGSHRVRHDWSNLAAAGYY